ncbi:hypothetical protein I8748_15190 [Nostoc sp. CENA67]|uniref:Uncharacterized protein n=1 Tax=Amazonocrinis nigriterrae CENA67 TaxID=2794033 RepID=A0A8J7L8S9_9NOST|nr:hypothetical protein [Amazonocrinis nigriterrae]MBH8563515.1 hypothetical protein [Amazonocrinis nigriterrae CENA67]
MDVDHHNFGLVSLKDYTFTLGKELSCGYDEQGRKWEEPELTEIRKKALIVKECPRKDVFFENIVLGYIQKCLDDTWLAHSPYTSPNMDMDICGFIDEFYAVRYLHQVIKSVYPDEIRDVPRLPWKQE